MLTVELQRELELTLEGCLLMAGPEDTTQRLAERLYESEIGLMARIARPLILERLTWMLHRKRQKFNAMNQLCLPGFENLPARITMKDGSRRALRSANLPMLIEFREVLAKRRGPKFKAVEKLIAIVAEYEKTHPGIVVGEVLSQEAQKQQREKL